VKSKTVFKRAIAICITCGWITINACTSTGVLEQTHAIPGHEWSADYAPECIFDITDTSSLHRIYFVIRHTDAYEFNNIWLGAESMSPGDTVFTAQRFDLPLTLGDRWAGTAMDDIREHRILLYREPVKFSKPGRYRVKLHQQMRQDPLQHVMNAGLRIERVER
jgi:gliding motility-associated lipoprotein GldH